MARRTRSKRTRTVKHHRRSKHHAKLHRHSKHAKRTMKQQYRHKRRMHRGGNGCDALPGAASGACFPQVSAYNGPYGDIPVSNSGAYPKQV